jgi:hypothetical protein
VVRSGSLPRTVIAWELVGAVFVFLAGSLLHFTYAWSGENALVGVFAAIDESVWEHLKLAFWPGLVHGLAGFLIFGQAVPNHGLGKALGLLVTPCLITAGFYGYTALLGHHLLALDIGLFGLAIAVGHGVSLAIYRWPTRSRAVQMLGIALLFGLTVAFSAFTYARPPLGMFQPPQVIH